jgi:delta 1-pyrroline-5-carboxylate dehydrogenase
MQESAPARQLAQAFKETVSPYVGMMHAAGAQNPIQAVGGILQQWAVLQSGDVQSKASLIASLIGRTCVPLDVINQHLGGNGQQGQEPQAFDPVAFRQQMKQELMQDLQGQRQQAMQNRALQEVEAFIADPKNEWADDLREETSALMTAAAARGKTLTIQDAHQQAIWSNPETRAILQARQKQEAAKASIASTQQARIAASSVKSTPSTGASSTRAPKTDRERVEAAYDSLDGR